MEGCCEYGNEPSGCIKCTVSGPAEEVLASVRFCVMELVACLVVSLLVRPFDIEW